MTSTLPDILPSVGLAASPRFHPAIWPMTAHSDDDGRLCVGEVALTDIADEFGTPTYVIDEVDFRSRARSYRAALNNTALGNVEVLYAGKSLLTIAVARWAHEEGLGIDVCSAGELAIAMAGGVEKARIVMHGNAKSQDDLRAAVRFGVGRGNRSAAHAMSSASPITLASSSTLSSGSPARYGIPWPPPIFSSVRTTPCRARTSAMAAIIRRIASP